MVRKSAAIEIPTGTSGEGRGVTILIVEDSPVQAELLSRELEGAGYQIILAGNGAEGLAKAKSSRPDAVVSDINMPLMDGYAMCSAIRREQSLRNTPVILLTMLSDPEDVIRGLEAGADAYVTKPYNVPSLVSRIASLLTDPPAPPPDAERRRVAIRLSGATHTVDAHGPRILNLLISTYENAVLQNRELAATQQALEDLNQHLEQKVLEKTAELRESERRFRALIENSSDLVLVIDARGTLTYVSPSVKRVGGYEPGELLGKGFAEFVHPEDLPTADADWSALVHNPGRSHAAELRYRRKEGDWITLETVARSAIDDPTIAGVVVNARDISERKRAEEELRRLNWALRALGQSNSALVHAGTENELFQACCDAIAGTEGYPLAWVGLARDDPGRTVEVVAVAGKAIGYMDDLAVSWSDVQQGGGPTGTAIRTGTTQVTNDVAASATFSPWAQRAYKFGLASSISLPIPANGGAVGALVVCGREVDAFGRPEVDLFEELAADIGYGIASRRTRAERDHLQQEHLLGVERLKGALIGTIGAVALTVEKRDPYTAGHQQRVAALCAAIGRKLGWPEDRIEGLRLGATIHDIGKISVPAEILSRPGKLAPLEFEIIKSHPQVGYDIVKDVKFPWPVRDMILQHHERLDGSGYPQRLKGDEIIFEARILAIADVVEAMSSHRPYRPGLGLDRALEELAGNRGRCYDPSVADACIDLYRNKEFSWA